MLANLQDHSTWGCYSCSINVKQHPQIYGLVNPEKLLLLGFSASPELLAFFGTILIKQLITIKHGLSIWLRKARYFMYLLISASESDYGNDEKLFYGDNE